MNLKTVIQVLQIVVPCLLVIFILFQQRGTALGSAFGGGGGFYASRRGAEKKIFWITVVLGSLFIIISLVNLIL